MNRKHFTDDHRYILDHTDLCKVDYGSLGSNYIYKNPTIWPIRCPGEYAATDTAESKVLESCWNHIP